MTIAQQAQDTFAIISDLGFDKALILGNGGNGIISVELAASCPELIIFLIVNEMCVLELPDAKKWCLFSNDLYVKSQKKNSK